MSNYPDDCPHGPPDDTMPRHVEIYFDDIARMSLHRAATSYLDDKHVGEMLADLSELLSPITGPNELRRLFYKGQLDDMLDELISAGVVTCPYCGGEGAMVYHDDDDGCYQDCENCPAAETGMKKEIVAQADRWRKRATEHYKKLLRYQTLIHKIYTEAVSGGNDAGAVIAQMIREG